MKQEKENKNVGMSCMDGYTTVVNWRQIEKER